MPAGYKDGSRRAGPTWGRRIPRRTTIITALLCLLLLVAMPAVYLAFLLNFRSTPAQQWALMGALGTAAAAFALGWFELTPAQRVLRALVIGGSLLVAGAATWNFIVRALAQDRWGAELERGAFRTGRLSHHWPMYGRYAQTELWRAALVVTVAALSLWRLVDGYRRGRGLTGGALAELALLHAALACAFAFSEARFAQEIHFRSFRHDLPKFASAAELMRDYVARMPGMYTFSKHYPPGFLLALWLEQHWHLRGIVAGLTVALTGLAVFPLAGILRELRAPPRVAWSAAGLALASAGILIYPTLAPTPATLLPGLAAVWLLLRAMRADRAGVWGDAAALGAVMALHTFFSFAVIIVVLYLTLLAAGAVAAGASTARRVAGQVAISLLVFALIFLALRWATGFDIVRCFRVGAHEVTRSMGTAFDTWDRYLLRGSGSMLAYLLSAGIPLAVLGMTPKFRATYPGSPLVKATVLAAPLAMLLAVLLGLGHLETERIWLFFTPVLAVTAAFELHRRAGEDAALFAVVVLLALLWACAQELCYRHY